jgi:hypothetical protein
MVGTDRYFDLMRHHGGQWYDRVVALEPGAWRATINGRTGPDHRIPPLIDVMASRDRISDAKLFAQHVARSEHFDLWIPGGTPEERAIVRRQLPPHVVEAPLVERLAAKEDIYVRAMDVARHADRIYASPGYSVVWELHALGLIDRVAQWYKLYRDIEDVDFRLNLFRHDARMNRILANSHAHRALERPYTGVFSPGMDALGQLFAKLAHTSQDDIIKERNARSILWKKSQA